MARRILKTVVIMTSVMMGGFALFFFRPWSAFQPHRMALASGPAALARVFREWDRIVPYGVLSGASHPHAFRRQVAPLDFDYVANGRRRPIAAYLETANVQGLLALRDGTIVFEAYRGDTTAESRYHVWSATKSFTGTIVGMALKEGRIGSLDDRADRYAPRFAGTAYGETSIRHLLMMSSGIDFFHSKGFPNRSWMYWKILFVGQDLDDFAARLGRRVPAGTDFNYLATDTHVLSAVLRGVYRRPYVSIVQEKLWEPLGIGGDAIWSQHASGERGVAFGHCCLATRLQDFAHLGQLYLQDGVWEGRRLLPEGWVEMVGTPRAEFQEPGVKANGEEPESGYGMQFWVPPGYDGEFYAAGAFGQYLWIDLRRKVVVAQFAAQPKDTVTGAERDAALRAIAEAASRIETHAVGGGAPEAEPPPRSR